VRQLGILSFIRQSGKKVPKFRPKKVTALPSTQESQLPLSPEIPLPAPLPRRMLADGKTLASSECNSTRRVPLECSSLNA